MVLRNDDEQFEFVRLADARMEQVKEWIPQIETANEARSFIIGSTAALRYLAKNLLSSDVHEDFDKYIDSETKILDGMVERLRMSEGIL